MVLGHRQIAARAESRGPHSSVEGVEGVEGGFSLYDERRRDSGSTTASAEGWDGMVLAFLRRSSFRDLNGIPGCARSGVAPTRSRAHHHHHLPSAFRVPRAQYSVDTSSDDLHHLQLCSHLI
ncbi:hypothetical protein BDN71DRAFT_1456344 [Pleurotus eryngii]|uniref:Uncharacterized protein n=1 Tax=Pleurotus eryngii TaxID=5323 RepID=A0A9P5ZP13_PLEER|nr:hypothetical protein BDN71DRAFT_1456344 [Pleurotus eryngii]